MDWRDRAAVTFLEKCIAVGMRHSTGTFLKLRVLFGGVVLFSWTTSGGQGTLPVQKAVPSREETTQEFNQRLEESRQTLSRASAESTVDESRIGPDDMLEI